MNVRHLPLLAHSMRALLAIATVSVLAACGGGGSDASPQPQPPVPGPGSGSPITSVAAGQRAERIIGAAGGSISLTTSESAVFNVQIPAGAVEADTTVAIETLTATSSQRFHLRLTPAGTIFRDGARATVSLQLPSSLRPPAGAALGYDGAPVPYTVQGDGSLAVQLARFADIPPTVSVALKSAAIRSMAASNAIASTCAGIPEEGSFVAGGLTASNATQVGQCMLNAVNRLASSGRYEDAVRLASATARYLQTVGEGDAGVFIAQASSIACTAYAGALNVARQTSVTTMGRFNALVRPILFWESATQQLGANCSSIPVGEYQTVIAAKAAEIAQYYLSQQGTFSSVDSPQYASAVTEARESQTTLRQVKSLQPPAAVSSAADAAIKDTAQPALLDAILQAPWQRCRDSGEYGALIELMQVMESPEAVRRAAQYCGTRLTAVALDSGDVSIGTLDPALGGQAAGRQNVSGRLGMVPGGKLQLTGPIRALQCPAGSAGTESLEIRFNGQLVQTLAQSNGYLHNPIEITLASLLQAVNLAPENFTSGSLTLVRAGTPCAGFWGAAPQPLLSLTLEGRVCRPESGRAYCLTVLSDLDGGRLDFEGAYTFSDQGGHFLVARPDGSYAVWHRGTAVDLPMDFNHYANDVTHTLADDGTVAGGIVQVSGGIMEVTPAVFRPATASVTALLAEALPRYTTLTGAAVGGGDALLQNVLRTMTISPQGRVTFTVTESSEPPLSTMRDPEYCAAVSVGANQTGYECVRYRRFVANGPNYGTAAAVETRSPNSLGDAQFPTFDGGTGVGYAGYATELVLTENASGTPDAHYVLRESPHYQSTDLETEEDIGHVHVVDRQGRALISDDTGVFSLRDAAALDSGWTPVGMSLDGHVLAMPEAELESGAVTRMRLYDLDSSQMLFELTEGTTVQHRGQSVEVQMAAVTRRVDSSGRFIAIGHIDATSRNVPVIVTPAGEELP